MVQTLAKNWWLLALAGVIEATISITYLFMRIEDGPPTFHLWKSAVVLLGRLALTAGACTIAAGLWRYTDGKCWLLVLNGLALYALGLIYIYFLSFRISFRSITLLIIVMAVSLGILELRVARIMRSFALAGAASSVFACAFLALGFSWIRLGPGSHADLLLLGSYFGLSAICMLGLALYLRSPRVPDLNISFSLSQF